MITQQHENEIQQKAQEPSPVKQHRWRVALFSILGVLLPLVAGLIIRWPLWIDSLVEGLLVISFSAFVSVAVGALLLNFAFRVWWVAVFAGGAWIVGELMGAAIRPLVEGGWPALQAYSFYWSDQKAFIIIAFVPLLLGMAVGRAVWLKVVKRGVSGT